MSAVVKYVPGKRGKDTWCLVLQSGIISQGTIRTACGLVVSSHMGLSSMPQEAAVCSKCKAAQEASEP